MKKTILLSLFTLMFGIMWATPASIVETQNDNEELNEVMAGLEGISMDDIMSMTPKKYKEITGKKMGFKNAVKLKMAKRFLKKKSAKAGEGISKGLYIFLALIGWAWIVMGVKDDWNGPNWIIGLVLGFFTCIGGLIFALVKMKDYY